MLKIKFVVDKDNKKTYMWAENDSILDSRLIPQSRPQRSYRSLNIDRCLKKYSKEFNLRSYQVINAASKTAL